MTAPSELPFSFPSRCSRIASVESSRASVEAWTGVLDTREDACSCVRRLRRADDLASDNIAPLLPPPSSRLRKCSSTLLNVLNLFVRESAASLNDIDVVKVPGNLGLGIVAPKIGAPQLSTDVASLNPWTFVAEAWISDCLLSSSMRKVPLQCGYDSVLQYTGSMDTIKTEASDLHTVPDDGGPSNP